MVILVRHGKTAFNDPGEERIRSWKPLALDKEGVKQAQDVGVALSDVEDIKAILASDLPRTVQTAHEIGLATKKEITPMEELRDIHQGDWEGRIVNDHYVKDWHYHVDHPDKKIPGGESVNEWIDRYDPILVKAVNSDDLYVIVGHGKSSTLADAHIKPQSDTPDLDVLKGKPSIDTGNFMIIAPGWEVIYRSGPKPGVKSV